MFLQEINAEKLVIKLKDKIKEIPEMKKPEWANFVKTGSNKERPPVDADWWYFRSAAILRKVAILGPIGVSKLRTLFGSKKRRGHKPEHFRRASGKIIRTMLQQLEKSGLIEKGERGVHKGRLATPKAISIMDKLALSIKKEDKDGNK